MNKKPGYKKTKLGWIPEEWKIKKLGKLFEFRNGVNASKEDYGKGIKFVNVMDVFGNTFITEEQVLGSVQLSDKQIDKNLVIRGDILFNRTSETQDEIGLTALYNDDTKAVFGGFVIRGRPKNNLLDHKYNGYSFQSGLIRKQIISKGQGAIRVNIGQSDLEQVIFPIPPLPEQKKIAEILSTWDEAIQKTEALIQKKEQLKKGLMQQLLTGKTRFDGFEGEWRELRISQIGSVTLGGTPSTTDTDFWNGEINWCTPTDITALKGKKYISRTERRITDKGLSSSSAKLLDAGTIVVCTRATIGDLAIAKKSISTNQGFKNLTLDSKKADIEFIYYLLLTKKKELIRKSSGSTFLELSSKDFKKIELELPPLNEQKKIAHVLSEIDSEIQSLGDQRNSLEFQKKGLMQQLLTGKKRVSVS